MATVNHFIGHQLTVGLLTLIAAFSPASSKLGFLKQLKNSSYSYAVIIRDGY